jgi:hypothetical protein
MTYRNSVLFASLMTLGMGAEQATAQPIAPPRRPTFSGYSSLFVPAGGGMFGMGLGYGMGGYGMGGYGMGGGYGRMGMGMGFGGVGNMIQQQNMMLQQQLSLTNQTLNNLQQFVATGVNPNYPATGHGAVFNSLGHWYPMASMGGGAGMNRNGLVGSMMNNSRIGQRTAGNGSPVGMGAPGAPASKTAGSGIPVPGGRR